jgi:hypothetical protein
LVDFFRNPAVALDTLGSALGLDLTSAQDLAFEYAVPVVSGSGKPSYTDLMILCPHISVAIEAKYTEGRYESVRTWLGAPPISNRATVLNGWLSVISSVVGRNIDTSAVLDLPYQLIHRTASACSTGAETRVLVYMIFGEDPSRHYAADITALDRLLKRPDELDMHVLGVPMKPAPEFVELLEQWDAGLRYLADGVRRALLQGQLFQYAVPRILYNR